MKNLFVIICLSVFSLCANAQKVVEGSLLCMKGETYMKVSLDCSQLRFLNDKPFAIFLARAPRSENWEKESLDYFFEHFNKKTFKNGFVAVPTNSKEHGKYELNIVPTTIDKGGSIKGKAILSESSNKQQVVVIEFKAEGDDNDEITLRDNMKELGDGLGDLFHKFLK